MPDAWPLNLKLTSVATVAYSVQYAPIHAQDAYQSNPSNSNDATNMNTATYLRAELLSRIAFCNWVFPLSTLYVCSTAYSTGRGFGIST